jgi:hypothetical protein
VVTTIYLVLNGIVIGSGLYYLWLHPVLIADWQARLLKGDWQNSGLSMPGPGLVGIGLASVLVFPRLALGLSGFEMSMAVMPLVRGSRRDPENTAQRIRHTQMLLVTAAVLMSMLLIGSSIVTTILISPETLASNAPADNRPLAFLAHGGARPELLDRPISSLFGETFGTLYDISTVLILCLAGASVMLGLRNLVPPYLHRLGMEFHWAHATGAMIIVFNAIKVIVTLGFHADVTSQRGALATSVVILMASAGCAVALDRWPKPGTSRHGWKPWFSILTSALFLFVALIMILQKPAGLQIALASIVAVLMLSMVSRLFRTNELRFTGFHFANQHSKFLWESLKYLEFPVLVPHRPGGRSQLEKEEEIRKRHRLGAEIPILFIEAELGDPSDFDVRPTMEVQQSGGRFSLRLSQCSSIAHAIAAIALEVSKAGKPPEIHFGWSDESPLRANLHFVLFGQGNVPWMVRELIRQAEPDPIRQPRVIIG